MARSEPNFLLLVENNVQSPHVSNASNMAGKTLMFGAGQLKQDFLHNRLRFKKEKYFVMKNADNFEEERDVWEAERDGGQVGGALHPAPGGGGGAMRARGGRE